MGWAAFGLAPRDPDESHRVASPLELFTDLCYVVAIAQAAVQLHHAITEGHLAGGLVYFCAAFFAIWWAWLNFAWFNSAYDPDDVPHRLLTLLQILGSLVLAAGGGYVFYASIRPVSIEEGYGSVLFDFPWILAYLVLAAVWMGGPVILLVLGLIHLLRHARHRWWSAACWLIMLAAGVAIGFLIMHGYRLLF